MKNTFNRGKVVITPEDNKKRSHYIYGDTEILRAIEKRIKKLIEDEEKK